MADEPIISLRGVTKVYGEGPTAFQALKGIDLDIAQGDFVAVMGPSGSGKSTTMNILGCLDVPSGGAFLFKGRHVETLDRDQRALLRRRYLGCVFQGFSLCSVGVACQYGELFAGGAVGQCDFITVHFFALCGCALIERDNLGYRLRLAFYHAVEHLQGF